MSNTLIQKLAAKIAIESIFDMDSSDTPESVSDACRLSLYNAIYDAQSLNIVMASGEQVSLEPHFEVFDNGESRDIIGLIEAVYNQSLSSLSELSE
ncbi:hypothetical protein LMH73_019275 [Vibrio splendidus]|nr:hypothetical protein [Vibrio splendidus]MCC4883015.1 hypothetical protein [Vibrio splendidus]